MYTAEVPPEKQYHADDIFDSMIHEDFILQMEESDEWSDDDTHDMCVTISC